MTQDTKKEKGFSYQQVWLLLGLFFALNLGSAQQRVFMFRKVIKFMGSCITVAISLAFAIIFSVNNIIYSW